jgi:serine protease Do
MTAARVSCSVWVLSVSMLLTGPVLAQETQALAQKTPALAQKTPAAQKAETSKSVSPKITSPALNLIFQKARLASLQINDCAPVASDPSCSDPNGYGAGVLISADGQILTAYHVVYGATRLVAVGADKKQYPLSVVGFDDQHDLALLKINVSGAAFVPLSAQPPRIGQAALAIGNSGGRFLQPKTGKLLGLDLAASQADFPPGTLQLDAPLAPGDSGGPVLNDAGQLIGITSYIQLKPTDKTRALSPEATVAAFMASLNTTSYAVPVTAGSTLLADLQAGVKREAPVVGISAGGLPTEELPVSFFKSLGLGNKAGFVFTGLTTGGPADLAGLRPLKVITSGPDGTPTKASGDVITAVDGKSIASYYDFLAAIRAHQVGDLVTLTVFRDGGSKPLSIPVKLAPRIINKTANK